MTPAKTPQPLSPAYAGEIRACVRRLKKSIHNPTSVPLLAAFYDPSTDYAGHTFVGPTMTENSAIDTADLLAVTVLDVCFRPRALRQLQDRALAGHRSAIAALDRVPKRLAIADARDDQLQAAYTFRSKLANLVDGRQDVAVQKLSARKRPYLIPVFDRVIRNWLDVDVTQGGYWKTIRGILANTEIQDGLRRLAEEAEAVATYSAKGLNEIPDLRLFDSLIWMLNSKGAAPLRQKI